MCPLHSLFSAIGDTQAVYDLGLILLDGTSRRAKTTNADGRIDHNSQFIAQLTVIVHKMTNLNN